MPNTDRGVCLQWLITVISSVVWNVSYESPSGIQNGSSYLDTNGILSIFIQTELLRLLVDEDLVLLLHQIITQHLLSYCNWENWNTHICTCNWALHTVKPDQMFSSGSSWLLMQRESGSSPFWDLEGPHLIRTHSDHMPLATDQSNYLVKCPPPLSTQSDVTIPLGRAYQQQDVKVVAWSWWEWGGG